MKGIILAGGKGSRLYPTTYGVSKHLIPVYDKPMIYYPLSVLMLSEIRDILIITTPNDTEHYRRLLGDGSNFGLNLSYAIQPEPDGLAQSITIGKDFIGIDSVCLILGDNIFYGSDLRKRLLKAKERADHTELATIFTSPVKNPEDFGVAYLNSDGIIKELIEKPKEPKSNNAVTGLYFYPNQVIKFAEIVKPSSRGELEITDVNNQFLKDNKLICEHLGRGYAWLDTGTVDALMDASHFVQAVEKRQGYKIACLEEIALHNSWLSKEKLLLSAQKMNKNSYGDYLLGLGMN
tara:strand:- start:2092 stop:2967 length:876 start_codon:yes stop_codon:yes gene_type:complete